MNRYMEEQAAKQAAAEAAEAEAEAEAQAAATKLVQDIAVKQTELQQMRQLLAEQHPDLLEL